jgi:hypothetical protein
VDAEHTREELDAAKKRFDSVDFRTLRPGAKQLIGNIRKGIQDLKITVASYNICAGENPFALFLKKPSPYNAV